MKKVTFAIVTTVVALLFSGCASSEATTLVSGPVVSGAVLSDAQTACRHVRRGHARGGDAEACSKAVMRSYRRAVGTGRLICWVDMRGVSCVPRYHVDRWQVHAYIRDNGKAWHIQGVSYPKTGTFVKAPLSGMIT